MSRATWWVTVGLVGLVAVVSFALSAAALVNVATWAGVHGPITWGVPVMLDAGSLAFTLAGFAQRARGERARVAWWSLAVLAVVSVVANVTHGLAAVVAPGVRLAVGVATVGIAPLVVLVAVHVLAGLVAPHEASVAAPSAAEDDVEAPEDTRPAPAPHAATSAPTAGRAWEDVPLWDDEAPSERDDVAAMRAMRAAGATLREVGAAYGVHASTVSRRLAVT